MSYGTGSQQAGGINVGSGERVASTLLGGALLVNGVVRPSLWHTVLAFAGAALLQRGVSGHCSLYSRIGVDTTSQDRRGATYGYGKRGQHSLKDEVNLASDHSFPASDPPSWSPTTTGQGAAR